MYLPSPLFHGLAFVHTVASSYGFCGLSGSGYMAVRFQQAVSQIRTPCTFSSHVCHSQTRISTPGCSMCSLAFGGFEEKVIYHQRSSPAFCRARAFSPSNFSVMGHHRPTSPSSSSRGSMVTILRMDGA